MTVLGQESAKPDNAMAGFGQRPQSMTMTFMTASRIRWWTTRLPAACFEMFWSFKTLIIPKLSKIWQYLIAMIVIIDIITIYIYNYIYNYIYILQWWVPHLHTRESTRLSTRVSYTSLHAKLLQFTIESTLLFSEIFYSLYSTLTGPHMIRVQCLCVQVMLLAPPTPVCIDESKLCAQKSQKWWEIVKALCAQCADESLLSAQVSPWNSLTTYNSSSSSSSSRK